MIITDAISKMVTCFRVSRLRWIRWWSQIWWWNLTETNFVSHSELNLVMRFLSGTPWSFKRRAMAPRVETPRIENTRIETRDFSFGECLEKPGYAHSVLSALQTLKIAKNKFNPAWLILELFRWRRFSEFGYFSIELMTHLEHNEENFTFLI